MSRWIVLAGLLVMPPAVAAAPDEGKLVSEFWENALLKADEQGFIKVGHVHFTVRSLERNGQTVLRSTMELRLTIRRGNATAKVDADTGTEETPEGKVLGVFMRQAIGAEQTLVMKGVVEGEKLRLSIEGQVNQDKLVPWHEQVVGLLGEQNALKTHKVKPGDTFEYLMFEPTLTVTVPIRVRVGDFEEIPVVNGKRKVLKAVVTPAKVQGIQLPSKTIWADADSLAIIQSEFELPGIGNLRMVRASKEHALAPPGAMKVNILEAQAIQLPKSVPQIHSQRAVTYRLTFPAKDEGDPLTAFSNDGRQLVKGVDGLAKTVDVTVEAVREPRKLDKDEPAGEEYLKSNFFLNSDDARVREFASKAVGTAKDPWDKARLIEKWVNRNMKSFNFGEAMATADEVARTLTGDCSEYAMLTAAMCKAQGVPARTAIGVIYVEARPKPTLAFHMWTEVYVRGQWLAIDATLGLGAAGPGHLKITDTSWYNESSFKPLLPVMRVINAKPQAEVVRVYSTPSP